MLDFQNLDCSVCHRQFAGQDDIVVCPHCGAPHHRECWERKGHCAFEKKHGTAEQWRRPLDKSDDGTLVCGNCGHVNEVDSAACIKCGRTLKEEFPLTSEEQQSVEAGVFYSRFSPYAGIAPDSTMDGQAVMDMAAFVGPNAAYYMARFYFMRMQHTKVSWNWAAALFPLEWLLYRKLTRPFWFVLAISLLLSLPYLTLIFLTIQAIAADPALMESFLSSGVLPDTVSSPVLVIVTNIGSLLSLLLRGIMAFYANHIYYRHVVRSMERIKKAECPQDRLFYRFTLSRRGGTSLRRMLLFYAAVILLAVAGAVVMVGAVLP